MSSCQDLLRHFRAQVSDEDPPYLWSDEEALAYLIDAQDMFVRLTGGINDRQTLAICQLAIAPGDIYAAHSPFILRIRSIWLVTAKRYVTPLSETDLPNVPVRDYGTSYGWGRWLSLDDTDTGDVDYAIMGLQENKLRWVRVPTVADTALMHVMRLPYPRLSKEEDSLEIDVQHHLHLLKWMKHLAYSKEDGETYDRQLADKNETLFRDYCAAAKVEIGRKRHKTRVVQYRGL